MIFHKFEIERATLYISKLFDRGRSVKIEPVTRTKSLSQVAYCWLCFTIIGQDTGNSKDDIYQLCLHKFPVFKSIEVNGVITMIPITMSGFDKDQMSHFIDEFTTYFRSEGFTLPDPDDKKALDSYNFYKERNLI